MAANYDQLISKLNDSIKSQVKDVYTELSNVTSLKSYNQDGQGDFPYWLTTGPQNSFNDLTYSWIDQVVKYIKDNDAYANTSNDMVGQLATVVYPKLSYALNESDNQKLTKTQTATAAEATNLVTQYTQNVGPIPATETNNLSYVTGQILTWGKAGETLSLVDLKNSFDLNNELPNMPAGGSSVLPALTKWLNAASNTLSLQNSVSFGNAYINYLKSSVKQPNAATSIATLDPTIPSATPVNKPRWTVNENSNALLNSLQNKGKKVNITVAASQSNSTTTNLSINGSAGASFGVGWLSFGVSGSASYNVYTANKSQASATVEISYPGVTKVTAKPMSAKLAGAGAEGWMDQTVLTQARENGNQLPPPQSGYIFSPALPNATDLGSLGNFGYMNTILISDQPTIKITYEGGDSSVYKSVFKEETNWSVKLFGLFTIAKGSQSYYKAKVDESSSGSGFTITIEPDGSQFTVPDSQKRANVLAAAATWPGDAS